MQSGEEIYNKVMGYQSKPGVPIELSQDEWNLFYNHKDKLLFEEISEIIRNGQLQEAAERIEFADNYRHVAQRMLYIFADSFPENEMLFDLIIRVYQHDGYNFPKSIIQKAKRISKKVAEEKRLAGLPDGDIITVYRGCLVLNPMCGDELKRSVSWTIQKRVAVWFAERMHGIVWEATITRDKIIAYTNERNEYEVIQHMNIQNQHICDISKESWDSLLKEELEERKQQI